MTTPYITLAQAKSELKAETTTDDAKVYSYIRQFSARVDRLFQSRRPVFAPYVESRQIRVAPEAVNTQDNTLYFPDNLLAISTVVAGTTGLTSGTDFEAWPTLSSPIHRLRLLSTGNDWYSYCTTDGTPLFVTIAGIWGFHSDYANAWAHVDDLVGNITASVTSLTVADVDGGDLYGQTPRISAGNLLRIGTEYLEVLATNTTTNVVTVRRGVNGSTAAAHTTGDDVEVWQVEESLLRIARQVAFMYARRGAFESSTVTDFGVVNFPSDILSEIRGIMQGFAYD